MCKAIQDMREESIAIGKAEGKAEGIAIGEATGRKNGMFDTLFGLVKDGLLSLAQAAARVEMTEEQFEEKMQKAGYTLS